MTRIYEGNRGLMRLRMLAFPCLLCLGILTPATVWATAVQAERLDNYIQRVWQTQDGLPEANVRALIQTQDHYLWIGTAAGLVRFDGERFVVFNRENTPAFQANGISSLMAARNGDLWIGTNGGGLIRYRRGQFINYSGEPGFNRNVITSLVEDKNGRIWIGTYSGLFFLDGDRLVSFKGPHRLGTAIFAMAEDRHGGIWIGANRLLRLEGSTVVEVPLPELPTKSTVVTLMVSSDDTLWIGSAFGGLLTAKLDASGMPGIFSRIPGITGQVRALCPLQNGSVWIGTVGQGSYSYRNKTLYRLITPAPLPSNATHSIFQDGEGNIWFGTLNGLIRLARTPISLLHLPDAVDADFQTLYADPQGPLWVASTHLFDIHKGVAKRVELHGLSHAQPMTLFRDNVGALWVGTNGQGVFRLKNDQMVRFTTQNGLSNDFIQSLLQTKDNSVWIGSRHGLNRWHNGQLEIVGRLPFSVRVLTQDHEGSLWIGTDQGLFQWRDGGFISNAATTTVQNINVLSIYQDTDGALWIGTGGKGLFRWKHHVLDHLFAANRLLPDKVFAILQDKSNKFWISDPNGIRSIAANDLNALVEARQQTAPVRFYSVTDGFYTTQIYGDSQHTAVMLPNGEIWFPTINGPVRVSTKDESHISGAPPVVLHKVIVDGREVPLTQTIDLGTRSARIEVQYGAIDLRPQDKLHFRYKIEGFDNQWIDAGSRRTAYYTNIPPGKYRFLVEVFSLDTPDISSEVSLSLRRYPPFYRTWWFYTCCALLSIAIAYLIHYLRTQRLKERFTAVLNERSRVAREMHDTLLHGCTSVSSLLEALSITCAVPDETGRTMLDTARLQISSTIEEARQAIWGLRHNTLPQTSIANLLQEIVDQMAQQFTPSIRYEVLGKPLPVDQETSHQLLMVIREALFNAVRHGDPTKVGLTIRFARNQLQIEVEDDGKGFGVDSLNRSDEKMHYGLSVMRERIESIGGKFEMLSALHSGTQLTITVPLDRSRMESKANDQYV